MMCTAITLKTSENHHLIGRNFDTKPMNDLAVTVAPRGFNYLNNVTNQEIKSKYAFLGMSMFYQKHIIFADGINEKGLCCMILNLPKFASWKDHLIEGKANVAPYDVILWILSNFSTLSEVKEGLKSLNIVALPNDEIALATQTHWLVTDTSGQSIVIEQTKGKLTVYNNKVGVLTNSPTFDWHLNNLDRYIHVKSEQAKETKWGEQVLQPYSKGFGGIGIPGDSSSPSRFVKAAFLRNHVNIGEGDTSAIGECFHILDNVAMVRGTVEGSSEGGCYLTQYTSCICLENQRYYYKTYESFQIQVIDLKKENLDAKGLKIFPYLTKLQLNYQN